MVAVQNVSKLYRLYDKPVDRILEAIPFRRRSYHRDFWALKDVSFRVEPGEIFGLIGPNGSGKSTVLQVAVGIVRPTKGRVAVEGRIAALLELGSGFNPEFTGRENVFLNGEILGMSRSDTQRIFPAVMEFADIGEFIDRPVKEYSSGMYVRLAFATAIHVEPQVLIVDEALAVGDAAFANRCLRKLEELKTRNVTILFVSHDLGLVKRLCHRAALMYRGEIVCQGNPSDVVNRYVGIVHDKDSLQSAGPLSNQKFRHGNKASAVRFVELLGPDGGSASVLESGRAVTIHVSASFSENADEPIVGILIRNRLGIDVFGTNTRVEEIRLGRVEKGQTLSVRFQFPCLLTRGEYTLTVATQSSDGSSQDWQDDLLTFTVADSRDVAGIADFPTEVHWTVSSDA